MQVTVILGWSDILILKFHQACLAFRIYQLYYFHIFSKVLCSPPIVAAAKLRVVYVTWIS